MITLAEWLLTEGMKIAGDMSLPESPINFEGCDDPMFRDYQGVIWHRCADGLYRRDSDES